MNFRANLITFDSDEARDMSPDDDITMQLYISKDILRNEPDLFQTKWFDYRRMTPVQATREYIDAFGASYRAIYAREIDFEKAEHVKPPTTEGLMVKIGQGDATAKRNLTGFWKGRQVADALGCPYDIYTEMAMTYRMRRWQRTNMPRPEHLYRDQEVEKIQVYWEEVKASRFVLPKDPAFLVQNFDEIPFQNDFHEYLFSLANTRQNYTQVLALFIERNLMPIDKVAARVTPEQYQEIERFL